MRGDGRVVEGLVLGLVVVAMGGHGDVVVVVESIFNNESPACTGVPRLGAIRG